MPHVSLPILSKLRKPSGLASVELASKIFLSCSLPSTRRTLGVALTCAAMRMRKAQGNIGGATLACRTSGAALQPWAIL